MSEAPAQPSPVEIQRLTAWKLVREVFAGVGIVLGLALLWGLETVRNGYFLLLERLNLRPRARRGSAFPPGRPRKRRLKRTG